MTCLVIKLLLDTLHADQLPLKTRGFYDMLRIFRLNKLFLESLGVFIKIEILAQHWLTHDSYPRRVR